MASKYRIKETAKGYGVFYLKNYGNGCGYEDTGRRFTTKDDAQAYIEAEREAAKHEKK